MKRYSQLLEIISTFLIFILLMQLSGCVGPRIIVPNSDLYKFDPSNYTYFIHGQNSKCMLDSTAILNGILSGKIDMKESSNSGSEIHIYPLSDSVVKISTDRILSFPIDSIAKVEVSYPKNSIYFELFGNGGLYSINYERNFHQNINFRIGFSSYSESWGFSTGTIKTRTVPVTLTWVSGQKANHFEIGGGALFGNRIEVYNSSNPNENSDQIIDITGFIGYRYQPQGGIMLFRIGLTPFLPIKGNYPSIFLSGGISLGVRF